MSEPKLEINTRCTQCDVCILACPENSILKNNNVYSIENWSCSLCAICISLCPVNAIEQKSDLN